MADTDTQTPWLSVEELNANGGALAAKMGILFIEANQDRVVATMPVEGNTQPYGLLHGGASVVLAETLGSIGAALLVGDGDGHTGGCPPGLEQGAGRGDHA